MENGCVGFFVGRIALQPDRKVAYLYDLHLEIVHESVENLLATFLFSCHSPMVVVESASYLSEEN
jgi:hypothetical protein